MTGATILFRTVTGSEVGFGHLARCSKIADRMCKLGWHVLIALEGLCQQRFVGIEVELIEMPPDRCSRDRQEVTWLKSCVGSVDWLLIDHFGIDLDYEIECRTFAKNLAIIDGMLRQHDCDLWIDPAIRSKNPQVSLNTRNMTLLTGKDYLLTDERFASVNSRALNLSTPGTISLLVSFGGSNQTVLPIVAALNDIGFDGRLIINADVNSLNELPAQHNYELEVLPWIDDMVNMLEQVDGVIGAGGGSAWERCLAGIPSIIFEIANNQSHVCSFLESAHAAIVFYQRPEQVDGQTLRLALKEFTSNMPLRNTLATNARRIHDGRGLDRVATALHKASVN